MYAIPGHKQRGKCCILFEHHPKEVGQMMHTLSLDWHAKDLVSQKTKRLCHM